MFDDDLAGEIKSATYAGIAKALSWKIQSSEEAKVKWEAENEDLTMELLHIKNKTCPEFREALLDSDQHIFFLLVYIIYLYIMWEQDLH